ncbi:dihydrolipoamide acetyltransferase family protein [Colwelliaceae bacterium 6471]
MTTNANTSEQAIKDITMPSLGADMKEGMLVEWLIKVGDNVKQGDIIAVLETQKGAIDMEVYDSGTITEILVQPVITVPVGTVLARLSLAHVAYQSDTETIPTEKIPSPMVDSEVAIPKTPLTKNVLQSTVQLASPIVRKLAEQQQLDLSTLTGTGPHGAIILKDLPNDAHPHATSEKLTDKRTSTKSSTSMRSAISAAMEKSKREIPHFYLSLVIDITLTQRWLANENKDKSPEQQILLLAVVMKSVALALGKFPQFNGFYRQGRFLPANDINIGNVVSLRSGGIMVPAIHHVEQLTLTDIMLALRDVTLRSRNGHLKSSEVTDATFTITNMGERGADTVFGVIYPDQVAIIGLGKPKKSAVVLNNNITIGDEITLCLSADHRVLDGMLAAKFLNQIAENLQKPESL